MAINTILLIIALVLLSGLILIGVAIVFKFKKEKGNSNQPNMWAAIRDILTAGMYTGQLMPTFLGLIVLVAVVKLKSEDEFKFLSKVVELFQNLAIFGWVLFFATVLLSAYFIKRGNKAYLKTLNSKDDRYKALEEEFRVYKQGTTTGKGKKNI